ncbi:MAG: lanthionine synthetase LanC family protein [Acidobacteriota bacterium]
MTRDEALEVALSIGRRVVRRAQWQGRRCTWQVWRRRGGAIVEVPATGEIYGGASGIAWFLAELFRLSGEEPCRHAAIGAMQHALDWAAGDQRSPFGFFSGPIGVAAAAARLGAELDRPDFIQASEALLGDLAGREAEDEGVDVLSGAAGAIPALLELRRLIPGAKPLEMACALGEHLVERAHREPGGWSWRIQGDACVRHLLGYAHGASGIGLALLELAAATGRDRYRFAAEMAFLYERQFFDEQRDNWPDFRHPSLSEIGKQGEEALRQAARCGAIEPFAGGWMTAWCHGAPGIGLTRLRAYELTGAAIYETEAVAALRATLDLLGTLERSGEFSLCHGVAGLCELPLMASTTLGQPDLRQVCDWHATLGWKMFEKAGRPWPCGTPEQRNDCSLMTGESGMGYYFLRLADADVPSILCPRPSSDGIGNAEPSEDFHQLGRETVDEYFGPTIRVLESLEGGSESSLALFNSPLAEAPVETAYRELEQRIAGYREGHRDVLEDVFSLDRERYSMTHELTDFTAEFQLSLTRPTWPETMAWSARFRLADDCRLVTTERDWQAWSAADAGGPPSDEKGSDLTTTLLHRRGNRIETLAIGPLIEAILQALPATMVQIFDRVSELVDPADPMDSEALGTLVERQLEQLYAAGLIDEGESEIAGQELCPSSTAAVRRSAELSAEGQPPVIELTAESARCSGERSSGSAERSCSLE